MYWIFATERTAVAILTLADMLVPAVKIEFDRVPTTDGRLLNVEHAGRHRAPDHF